MTKNVLATSCSEVSVKRLFNLARDVITYRRERLNSTIIETIMMLKYNLNIDCTNAFFEQSVSVDEFFADELSLNAFDILFVIIFESSSDDDNENDQYASDENNVHYDDKKMLNAFVLFNTS